MRIVLILILAATLWSCDFNITKPCTVKIIKVYNEPSFGNPDWITVLEKPDGTRVQV